MTCWVNVDFVAGPFHAIKPFTSKEIVFFDYSKNVCKRLAKNYFYSDCSRLFMKKDFMFRAVYLRYILFKKKQSKIAYTTRWKFIINKI